MAADIDIVERLRDRADNVISQDNARLFEDAADTITALRSRTADTFTREQVHQAIEEARERFTFANQATLDALRSRIEELERELADMEEARDKAEEEGNKLNCMRAIAERERDEARGALRKCRETLAMMIEPHAISGSTVVGAYAAALEAEAEARRALGKERT